MAACRPGTSLAAPRPTHPVPTRAGWDKGCLTMRLGERAKLTIRGDKGYGPAGFPAWGIKPNATLFFEITILSIN